ncbi:MAG: hypothetical protein HY834_11895 [Devosia nanyangense]|uniref:Uncharacterized protein n=1 Tax=Devosia nanyangense TaxID=1228055 RepID=A0A933L417_9HYPH|nr:hypothetical protein [Devosia nanyangense]
MVEPIGTVAEAAVAGGMRTAAFARATFMDKSTHGPATTWKKFMVDNFIR